MSVVPKPRLKLVRVNILPSGAAQPSLNMFNVKLNNSPRFQSPFVISSPGASSSTIDIQEPPSFVKNELDVEQEVDVEQELDVEQEVEIRSAPIRKETDAISLDTSYDNLVKHLKGPGSGRRSNTVAQALKSDKDNSQLDGTSAHETTKGPIKKLQYCRLCDRSFKSHDSFVRHFSIDHPNITKPEEMFEDPWCCMYCNEWFDGPRRLSYHVKSEHKEVSLKHAVVDTRPQLVECKLCGAVLKSSLIKHTLKAHATEIDERGSDVVKDPRRCKLCSKMCSGQQGLRHHMYRSHGSVVAKGYTNESVGHITSPDPLPIAGGANNSKRSAAVEEQQTKKRGRKAKIVNYEVVEEEPVLDDMDEQRTASDIIFSSTSTPFEVEAASSSSTTFCDVCYLDLLNPVHYQRHFDLRHKPMKCPLCLPEVDCKGQIGLEAHDDSVHRGLIRLQMATSLT